MGCRRLAGAGGAPLTAEKLGEQAGGGGPHLLSHAPPSSRFRPCALYCPETQVAHPACLSLSAPARRLLGAPAHPPVLGTPGDAACGGWAQRAGLQEPPITPSQAAPRQLLPFSSGLLHFAAARGTSIAPILRRGSQGQRGRQTCPRPPGQAGVPPLVPSPHTTSERRGESPQSLMAPTRPHSLKNSLVDTGCVRSGQQGQSGDWGLSPGALGQPSSPCPSGPVPVPAFGSIPPCLDPNHRPRRHPETARQPRPRRPSRPGCCSRGSHSACLLHQRCPDRGPRPRDPRPAAALTRPLCTFQDGLPLGASCRPGPDPPSLGPKAEPQLPKLSITPSPPHLCGGPWLPRVTQPPTLASLRPPLRV